MKYLSDYMQDSQTALFNELGSFFAFSMEEVWGLILRCLGDPVDYNPPKTAMFLN